MLRFYQSMPVIPVALVVTALVPLGLVTVMVVGGAAVPLEVNVGPAPPPFTPSVTVG